MDLEKLTQRPDRFANVAAFGLEKRGKTTNCLTFILRLYQLLELDGYIGLVDTENMASDWYDRIKAVTGNPPAICPVDKDGDRRNPTHVRAFLQACADDGRVVAVVIDSMTDLQKGPRMKKQAKEGRQLKLNEYQTVDRPYNELVEWLKHAPIHCAYTFREADDRVEVDGEEKVVGKKPKGGDGGYVPRLIMHCTTARQKGDTVHVATVSDCKAKGTDRLVNPEAKDWDKYIERLK